MTPVEGRFPLLAKPLLRCRLRTAAPRVPLLHTRPSPSARLATHLPLASFQVVRDLLLLRCRWRSPSDALVDPCVASSYHLFPR